VSAGQAHGDGNRGRNWEGFRRSDKPMILALLTDDVAWDLRGFRHLVGKADFEGEILNPQFKEHPTLLVDRKIDEGDTVVCIGEGHGQMTAGDEFRFAFCDIFTFRDNLICRRPGFVGHCGGDAGSRVVECTTSTLDGVLPLDGRAWRCGRAP
jgi:ketosteroid isomerase-like protein